MLFLFTMIEETESLCTQITPFRQVYCIHYQTNEEVRQIICSRNEQIGDISLAIQDWTPTPISWDILQERLSDTMIDRLTLSQEQPIEWVNIPVEEDDTIQRIEEKISLILQNINPHAIYMWGIQQGGRVLPLSHSFYHTISKKEVGQIQRERYRRRRYDEIDDTFSFLSFPPNPWTIQEPNDIPSVFRYTEQDMTYQSFSSMILRTFYLERPVLYVTTLPECLARIESQSQTLWNMDETKRFLSLYFHGLSLSERNRIIQRTGQQDRKRLLYDTTETVSQRLKLLQYEIKQHDFLRGPIPSRSPTLSPYISPLIQRRQEDIQSRLSLDVCQITSCLIQVIPSIMDKPYIDLEKVFHMLPLTKDIPFARLKQEQIIEPKYKIHESLLDPIKYPETYMKPSQLRQWIENTKRKDIRYHEEQMGRVLTYKLFYRMTKDGEPSYITCTLFAEGYLDIRCTIADGGLIQDILDRVQRVKTFIETLNKFQFHLPSVDRTRRIPEPEPKDILNKIQSPYSKRMGEEIHQRKEHTRITSLHLKLPFSTEQEIDFLSLYSFGNSFFSYLSLIPHHIRPFRDPSTNQLKQQINTPTQFSCRYKRIHNFQHVRTIEKYIREIGRSRDLQTISKIELDDFVIKNISEKFNVTQDDASSIYRAYVDRYGELQTGESDDIVGVSLGDSRSTSISSFDIRRQPGIEMNIIPLQSINETTGISSTASHPYKYQIDILDCTIEQVGYIFSFIQSFLSLYIVPSLRMEVEQVIQVDQERIAKEAVNDVMIGDTMDDDEINNILQDLDLGFDVGEPDEDEGQINADGTQQEYENAETQVHPTGDHPEPREGETDVRLFNWKTKVRITPLHVMKDFLGDRLKDYKQNTGKDYAKTCQSSADKIPIITDVENVDTLRQEQGRQYDELKRIYEEKKDTMNETEREQLEQNLLGVEFNQKALEHGQIIEGKGGRKFVFCPVAWSFRNQTIPLYTEAVEQSKRDKTVYAIKSDKLPRRTYVLSFGDTDTCIPCCYVKLSKRHQNIIRQCMHPEEEREEREVVGPVAQTQNYVKSENKRNLETGRYAFLPPALNTIFNGGQSCPTTIDPTKYNCFLRRGVPSQGNSFLNAMAVLGGWDNVPPSEENIQKTIGERFLEWVISFLTKYDTDHRQFLMMKNGSIATIFSSHDSHEAQKRFLKQMENKFRIRTEKENETWIRQMNKLYQSTIERAKKYFISYLRRNWKELDETILWDLISRTTILSFPYNKRNAPTITDRRERMNLFIFEQIDPRRKRTGGVQVEQGFHNIVLRCPVGTSVDRMYGFDTKEQHEGKYPRMNVILFKYGDNTYELIIHRIKDKDQLSLPPNDPIIRELITTLQTCSPRRNKQQEQQLKQFARRYIYRDIVEQIQYQNSIITQSPFSSTRLYKILVEKTKLHREWRPYRVVNQILDESFQVIYFVLQNGVAVPVEPSSLLLRRNLPYTFYPLYQPQSYETTFRTLRILGELIDPSFLPLYHVYNPPVDYKPSTDGETSTTTSVQLFGWMTKCGMFVEIEPKINSQDIPRDIQIQYPLRPDKIETWGWSNLKETYELEPQFRPLQYLDVNPFEVNRHLFFEPSLEDDRLEWVRMSQFEQESYERFRFELSKWFQETREGRSARQEIVSLLQNSEDTRHQIRLQLARELFPLYDKLTTTQPPPLFYATSQQRSRSNDIVIDFTRYHIPPIRYPCFQRSLDPFRGNDFHCNLSKGKLFVPPVHTLEDKENRILYIARLVEELVRNPYKRMEVLQDQMDNFVDKSPLIRNDEYFLTLTQTEETYDSTYEMLDYFYSLQSNNYDSIIQRAFQLYPTLRTVREPVMEEGRRYVPMERIKWLWSSCQRNWRKLPSQLQTRYGLTSMRRIPNHSPDCFYFNFVRALNQRHSPPQVHTIHSLKEYGIQQIRSMSTSEWDHFLQLYRSFYPSTSIEASLTNREKWINHYRSSNHSFFVFELLLYSRLNIQCIFITKNKMMPFKCIGAKLDNATQYILLWYQVPTNVQIITDISYSPTKVLFQRNELPTSFIEDVEKTCTSLTSHVNILTPEQRERLFVHYFNKYHQYSSSK